MNKTRIIAFTLVLGLMLMGAGYAAWSETATINNAVGTGELKVEFVDDCDHPRILGAQHMNYSITHGAKITTVVMGNMYPGAVAYYETRIENLGSIPAVLNNVDVVFSAASTDEIKDNVRVWGMAVQERPGSTLPVDSSYIVNVPLRDLEGALETAMNGFNLQPGDYICFDVIDDNFKQELAENIPAYDPDSDNCLFFTLPACGVGNDVEMKCAQFDIIIDFKQFNQ